MKIAFLCTGALGLLLFCLSMLVSYHRLTKRQALGPGEDPKGPLSKACIAQSNTAQYAPMLAVLMITLQIYGSPNWLVWVSTAAVLGRYLYAAAILTAEDPRKFSPLKATGVGLTYVSGALMSLALFVQAMR